MKQSYKFFLVLFLILLHSTPEIVAQEPNEWTLPERIPDYGDEAGAPSFLADSEGTVHAFNTQVTEDGEIVLVYRQWSVDNGWTEPIDIFTGRPRLLGAIMDKKGLVHLAFFKGNERDGAIFYSNGHIQDIVSKGARAWSREVLIAENAGPFGFGTIAGDQEDNLFILYGGKADGIGLYSIYSLDRGGTWSKPAIVTLTYSDEQWPTVMSSVLDPRGKLHSVWSVWSSAGVGIEINYARLEPDALEWSQPTTLAVKDGDDYEADNPQLVYHEGELILVYQDSFPATKWMRRSFDGGNTWTEPTRPWPHSGEYGVARLLHDSTGRLHVILGNRLGDEAHGMWHGIWSGNRWEMLEPITSGPKTTQFDPTAPKAVISQGNILLATWNHDSAFPDNGIWYSYTTLDAPELSAKPLPTLPATATATPAATPIPNTPTPTPRPSAARLPSGSGEPINEETWLDSPAAPVVAGIIPIFFLIVIVFSIHQWYYRLHQ